MIHVHIWQALAAQWVQEQQQPEAGYGVWVCVCVREHVGARMVVNQKHHLKRLGCMSQESKTSKGDTFQPCLISSFFPEMNLFAAICRWWLLVLPSLCLLQNRRCWVNQRSRVGLLTWRLMSLINWWPMMRQRSVLPVYIDVSILLSSFPPWLNHQI